MSDRHFPPPTDDDVFGPLADHERAMWRGRAGVAEYAFDRAASLPRWTLPETTEVLVTDHRIMYAHTADDPADPRVTAGELSWLWPQHLRVQPGLLSSDRGAAASQIQLVCAAGDGSFPALVFAGGNLKSVVDADRLANVLRQAIARFRVENAERLGLNASSTRVLSRLVIGPEFSNYQGGDGQTVTLPGAMLVSRPATPEPAPRVALEAQPAVIVAAEPTLVVPAEPTLVVPAEPTLVEPAMAASHTALTDPAYTVAAWRETTDSMPAFAAATRAYTDSTLAYTVAEEADAVGLDLSFTFQVTPEPGGLGESVRVMEPESIRAAIVAEPAGPAMPAEPAEPAHGADRVDLSEIVERLQATHETTGTLVVMPVADGTRVMPPRPGMAADAVRAWEAARAEEATQSEQPHVASRASALANRVADMICAQVEPEPPAARHEARHVLTPQPLTPQPLTAEDPAADLDAWRFDVPTTNMHERAERIRRSAARLAANSASTRAGVTRPAREAGVSSLGNSQS